MLDSLVVFADIGDEITIEQADQFSFDVSGPYADFFTEAEKDTDFKSKNLVVKAAHELARILQQDLSVRIGLEKNLPLASGLGGGSSNAAETLRGLMTYWNVEPKDCPGLDNVMLGFGADVPVCFGGVPVIMRGIGDELSAPISIAKTPVVLVNPGQLCHTKDIFQGFDRDFLAPISLPEAEELTRFDGLISFLTQTENVLTDAAIAAVPEIRDVLDLLQAQERCRLARMSGSGASCFGLFEHDSDAQQAAALISKNKPDWWVKAGYLNGS